MQVDDATSLVWTSAVWTVGALAQTSARNVSSTAVIQAKPSSKSVHSNSTWRYKERWADLHSFEMYIFISRDLYLSITVCPKSTIFILILDKMF